MSKLECKYQFFVSGLEDTTVILDEHEKDTLARLALRAAKQKLQKYIKVRTSTKKVDKILAVVKNYNVQSAEQLYHRLFKNEIEFCRIKNNADKIKNALKTIYGLEFEDFDTVFFANEK